jgi:hypothetical protein
VIFDRDSGTKRATILVGIKHDRHQLALRTFAQRLPDLAHHLDIENIQRRPRERDSPNAILETKVDILVSAHAALNQSR